MFIIVKGSVSVGYGWVSVMRQGSTNFVIEVLIWDSLPGWSGRLMKIDDNKEKVTAMLWVTDAQYVPGVCTGGAF